METALETNTNDEIQVLRIKLEVVEKEMQLTIDRAAKAETELEQFKQLYGIGAGNDDGGRCRSCGGLPSSTTSVTASAAVDDPNRVAQVIAAPPPPPPMPKFNLPPTNSAPHGTTTTSLSDGIASITLNQRGDSAQQVKNATGRPHTRKQPHSHTRARSHAARCVALRMNDMHMGKNGVCLEGGC